ncbi:hypothetical protein A4U64_26770 (plasmid) [Rhodococcus sp. WB1]|uniref:hypothetical protein n=1 Tax=Rhodococcus sp. WB1 TaxID=1033922 RepID=UPI00081A8962|nr:hypothetical protein [Rhodococcus sp. WB1]ANZ28497.1 hypothetical protein A4U64_26770 [Rhodococcus sp. WB1]
MPSHLKAGQTRVILVGCSGILGDLIRSTLTGLPDMRVIRELSDGRWHRLVRVVRWVRPDVVIWQLEDDQMLAERPELFGAPNTCSVLTVLADGERGSVWRLRPQRASLGGLCPTTLITAVREAAMRP